jgi:hypothetical protein
VQNLTPGRHSPALALRALKFLWKRLNADPATKKLAPAVKKAYDTLRARVDGLEDAELDTQAATAEIEVCNEDLSLAFRPLTLGLNVLVGGSAKDPRRRRLLPKTPSKVLAASVSPEQRAFVQGVLEVLAKDADFKTLQVHAKPIASALAALDAKIAERSALAAKETAAGANLNKALQAACDTHNLAEPDVQKATGNNKRKTDSFFLKLAPARKTKAPTVPPP